MKKYAALLCTSMLFVGTANAEGFFVGGSLGVGDASLSTNTQFGEIDDRLYYAKGFGGYRVNDNFAVEGSLLAGTNDDYDNFINDVEATFVALSGAFVGIIPASDNFELYGKLGGYLGESEIDNFFGFGGGLDEDESGLVWGAGMYINFGPRNQFTVRVDYENYDTDVFKDLWVVSAGFQFNF